MRTHRHDFNSLIHAVTRHCIENGIDFNHVFSEEPDPKSAFLDYRFRIPETFFDDIRNPYDSFTTDEKDTLTNGDWSRPEAEVALRVRCRLCLGAEDASALVMEWIRRDRIKVRYFLSREDEQELYGDLLPKE